MNEIAIKDIIQIVEGITDLPDIEFVETCDGNDNFYHFCGYTKPDPKKGGRIKTIHVFIIMGPGET
jgi:hypothetical protein